MKVSKTFSLATVAGQMTVEVVAGRPLFILGHNGVGKSALVHSLVARLGEAVSYLPGSRPATFSKEELSLTPAMKREAERDLGHWDGREEGRWRNVNAGTSRNEKSVYNLQIAEVQYKVDAANEIAANASKKAITLLQRLASPLDRANRLLQTGNLPVRLELSNAELSIKRGAAEYSIARASDGERIAIVVIAETISAPAGTVFIIDEPELHLHRSITVPLFSALIEERPDCIFIVSTHELALPSNVDNSSALLVRGCVWSGNDAKNWDLDLIPSSEDIPDDLRTAVLGSRRKILFVEGTKESLDQPLYELLFPKISVRSRESCNEVRKAVKALAALKAIHEIEAYGLIDNDGLSSSEISSLKAEGIYALPIFSVESLYFCKEMRQELANHQAVTFKMDATTLVELAIKKALSALSKPVTIAHLAARKSEILFRQNVLLSLPSRKEIAKSGSKKIVIEAVSSFDKEKKDLDTAIQSSNLDGIIAKYPVRESSALDEIAKALKFTGPADYCQAALARLASNPDLVKKLQDKLSDIKVKLT